MIRSTKHSTKFSNSEKLQELEIFVTEYRRCLGLLIDFVWSCGYEWEYKGERKMFCIKENLLEIPPMLTSDVISKSGLETFLTGRALKCCLNQVAGMIKAETEKQRKRLFILAKKKLEKVPKRFLKKLVKKIKQNIPQKPDSSQANIELCSICADWRDSEGEFDGFLRLTSITKTKLDIRIPIKYTRPSLKWKKSGIMKTSFLITQDYICLRWEVPQKSRNSGTTIGADQGFKDVLTLSSGNVTPKTDNHGHSLESIINKVSKKKVGSKAFKRAKTHQTNFVNWSVNQLNLNNIQQINLEEIVNIGRSSKKLFHWQNTVIRDKVESKCEDLGIRLVLQSSTYRSQRCSDCGNVRKSNRKGKEYSCKNCGNIMDADLNAAKNHEIQLPDVPYGLRCLNLNRKDGFFWTPDGFFDFEGQELTVPEKTFL